MVLEHYNSTVVPAMKGTWPEVCLLRFRAPRLPTHSNIPTQEITEENSWEFVAQLTEQLHAAEQSYILPFSSHLTPVFDNYAGLQEPDPSAQHAFSWILGRLQRDVVGNCVKAIPRDLIVSAVGFLIISTGRRLFYIHPQTDADGNLEPHDPVGIQAARVRLLELLTSLRSVGLGGDRVSGIVSAVCSQLLDEFVSSHHMKVDWQTQRPIVPVLRAWVRLAYIPFILEIIAQLDSPDECLIQEFTAQQCEDMAVFTLGKARLANLFDYILRLHESMGAMADIKEFLSLPGSRSLLTSMFSSSLQTRVLHHGVATNQILDTYVLTVRGFFKLDGKGVLLDRACRSLRKYLRTRPDTIRVIISSLLASRQDLEAMLAKDRTRTGFNTDISPEVTKTMIATHSTSEYSKESDLDWENMEWTPDPIDAGPDYRRRSKSNDVIFSLLSLFDAEAFVSRLGSAFGENLLKFVPGQAPSDYRREEQVLALFKRRLGEDKLQACEVMLSDISESRKIKQMVRMVIRKRRQASAGSSNLPRLTAQIQSRLYWPAIHEGQFKLPAPVQLAQKDYSDTFEKLKYHRELQWFPSLGLARVELELADRKWEGECQTFQATVIHYFGDTEAKLRTSWFGPKPDPNLGVSRTVSEIEKGLEMDNELVVNALSFWQSHDVLVETAVDVWAVLERLPAEGAPRPGIRGAAKSVAAPAISAVMRPEDLWAKNKPEYRNYIRGILLANPNKTLKEIYGILKVTADDDVTFSVDDIEKLLTEMVEVLSELDVKGGKYSLLTKS